MSEQRKSRKATLVVGEKFGRLGNRLWLFAHVVAHGIEHQLEVVNPCFDEYSPYFVISESGLLCRFPARKTIWNAGTKARAVSYDLFGKVVHRLQKRQRGNSKYQIVRTPVNEIYNLNSEGFHGIVASKRYVILSGWRFRDYSSFEKHSEKIRHLFRPSREIEENVSRKLSEARSHTEVLVGIHIRQSDYKQFLNGAYHFDTVEYVKIMRSAANLFPEKLVRFLICSDEPQDAGQFSEFDFLYGSVHAVEDMMLLAGCDYIIGPPSTFTMWASFYGKVPLYRIGKTSSPFSLGAFQIIDGWFDLDADGV